jgi:NAD(P)-dependent dehydrogenase (short-subunit alcohol dehydrogenase family)
VQRRGESAFGCDEVHVTKHPSRERFARLVRDSQQRRRVRAGIDFMAEDGGDEVRALWKMAVHGAETDSRLGGDLPHRRIHSGSREHCHRRLQQRVHVPLSIGAHAPDSITAAAARVRNEFGRLDVLIQNAAISNTRKLPGQSVEAYAQTTRPSNVSLDEMRAVWNTNVFGVLAVYQAMLPLLREAPHARIVNVSSGVGSPTTNSDSTFTYRSIFGPVYPASKTAFNALTVAMALELEREGIKVNAVSPGFTKTNRNGYAGTETVEDGAREAVRVALLGPDSPTGTFTRWENETIPW